jgi:hypothetical protein
MLPVLGELRVCLPVIPYHVALGTYVASDSQELLDVLKQPEGDFTDALFQEMGASFTSLLRNRLCVCKWLPRLQATAGVCVACARDCDRCGRQRSDLLFGVCACVRNSVYVFPGRHSGLYVVFVGCYACTAPSQ